METRIYKSTNTYSIAKIVWESLKGYTSSFYLAKQLAKRDISAQYRQSYFGILWAIAPIILNSTVWIFLNGTGTVKLPATSVPYPLFVVIGTTLWSVMGDCLTLTMTTVNSNKSIITKINFEKEALVTLGLIKLLFNLLIKFALIFVFLIYFQVMPSLSILVFFPLLAITILFFVSLGILLTPIGVLYHDVSRAIPIMLQVLMYFTPVLYSVPEGGIMKKVMEWNPLTYIISNLRDSLTGLEIGNVFFLIAFTIITILLTLFSMIIYRISMPIITERMSA